MEANAGFAQSALGARLHETRIQFRIYWRNNLQKAALVFCLVLLVTAVVAPYVVPHPEAIRGTVNFSAKLQPPSLRYPFGTDEDGRDIFSRVLYGTRISLVAALVTVGAALCIGVPLGALSGAIGGTTDTIIMRVTDVFLSFPGVLLAIAIAAFLGPSLRNAIIAIAVSWWPFYTRLVRNQSISLAQRQFVRSAKVIGTPRRSIVFRHILPNALGPTIVMASLDLGSVILVLAALSFLGLGAQPPTPEWGLMINESRNYFLEAWWYMFFPGLAITLTVLAFNIVGDGIREVLDPKSRTL